MAEDMLLLWGSGSPPCWRVMIALEEKNLQGYKNKLLSFDKQEHKNPEVLQINPRGQLPVFKHGDVVVNESIAACLYLENRFKAQGTQLMPDSVTDQALVLQRMFEGNTLQQKMYDGLFYEHMVPEAERHESAVKRHRENLVTELKLWESYLEKMGKGSYLAGRSFSMADVVVFPYIAFFPRFGKMMSSAVKAPRPVLTVLLVLLGLGGVFYVYFLSSSDHSWEEKISGSAETKTPDPPSRRSDRDTVVLIWAWPFGRSFKQRSCGSMYNISRCYVTDDRGLYEDADAVMFHHKEVQKNLLSLQNLPRPPRQKWVWMNMESPANSLRLQGPDHLFNLTSSYRRDSDVWVPYGWVQEAGGGEPSFTVPNKDKLVCWIVKNWKENFLRVKYFSELQKHVHVETYGGHFGRNLSYWDYFKTLSTCKFYLSFENSVHKDYITEKLFNPMIMGSVPVVLGPSRENYEEFIPADSFIHVDDFKTPKELAEHLKLLDQNQEMYERFFTWRKHFVARRSDFGLEHACRICDHIKRNKSYRVFKNLNKWYWG